MNPLAGSETENGNTAELTFFDYPVAIQASVPSIFPALFELFCRNGYRV